MYGASVVPRDENHARVYEVHGMGKSVTLTGNAIETVMTDSETYAHK
jgi:hypothetical protein